MTMGHSGGFRPRHSPTQPTNTRPDGGLALGIPSLIVPVLNTVDPLCVGLIDRIWDCEPHEYMNWLVERLSGSDHFYMVRLRDSDLVGPRMSGEIDEMTAERIVDLAVDVQHGDLRRTYLLCTSRSVPAFANVDVVEFALGAIGGDAETAILHPYPDDAVVDPKMIATLLGSAFETPSGQISFYLPTHPAVQRDGPFSFVVTCHAPDVLTVTLMYGVTRLARALGGGVACISGTHDCFWEFTAGGLREISSDAAQHALAGYRST